MKNIFKNFVIYTCLYLMVGCAPAVPNYPTNDLVPAGEPKALDGVWKYKANPVVSMRFEGGRAYLTTDLYNKNGRLILRKNSITINNITQIGPTTYSCNAGSANRNNGIISYDTKCDIKLTLDELQYHEDANKEKGTRERYDTYIKVSLDNESLYLASLSNTTTKDNKSPSEVNSAPAQYQENKTVHEGSTARSQGSNLSSLASQSIETKLVQKDSSIAYDLRGAKLGMTLSDFKSLPHPDSDRDQNIKKSLICKNANHQELSKEFFVFNNTDKELNVTQCKWHPLPIISDLKPKSNFYHFVTPPDSDEPRLYRISIELDSKSFDKLSKGLQTKYGKPSKIDNSKTQNLMGATFSDASVFWTNTESTIAIFERVYDINTMILSYTHIDLDNYYSTHSENNETSKALNTL